MKLGIVDIAIDVYGSRLPEKDTSLTSSLFGDLMSLYRPNILSVGLHDVPGK